MDETIENVTTESVQTKTEPEEKPYKLRPLQASDIFTMSKLISKIGINEMKNVISPDLIKRSLDPEVNQDELEAEVGMAMGVELIQIMLQNLDKCESELYKLLSNLSGMKKEEIGKMELPVFMDMIVDVTESDGFMGFIKAASRLFK